jgi:Siphovirus protein of unknown function (DUF859)/Chaperone of endosialidase
MNEMATSGSFTGSRGGSSTGPYLKLSWSRIETDISGNKSKLRLTLQLISDYSINFSASKSGNLEGNAFTYTSGMKSAGTVTLRTLDLWYNHSSDGSLTTTLSASFNIAITWGSYISSLSVSDSITVDSIPRASGFTAFSLSNTTLNTSTSTTINYTLDRKSTSFSQDMTLKLGSTTIATWNTTGTGALTRTFSSTEVNKVINALPNSTSGTLTLTMQTKSGSTNIGSSVSKTVNISLNSAIKPSASGISVSIYGSGRDKTIGKFVQGLSKVTSSFTRSAGYGASISTSTITIKRQSDGGNSQTISSNSGTTANAVTLSGTYIAEGYVKDSRGRTATVSTTFTVEAYSPPSITRFTANRTSTTTTVSNAITVTWSIGASNPTTITVTSKNSAGVTATPYNVIDQTAGSLSTTRSYTNQLDTSSYVYTITVTDSFGKKATANTLVGTSFVEMSIARGKGVGIGKVHERGTLDVGGDAYISGKLNVNALVMNDGLISKETISAITGDSNGIGLSIGAGGLLVIGSGESSDNVVANLGVTGGNEQTYVTSDNHVTMVTGMQSGYSERHEWIFEKNGNFSFPDNVNGVYHDRYGNFKTRSGVTSATWNVMNTYSQTAFQVPLGQNNDPCFILGQFELRGNLGSSTDKTSSSALVFRNYASANQEYILAKDTTNGFYFGADHAVPDYGSDHNGQGNGQLYAAKYNVVSDEKQKENIERVDETALHKIKSAKAYTYDHKSSDERRLRLESRGIDLSKNKKSLGLIAQEAPVEITTDEGTGIDLYAMNTLLWKAVQELSEQVEYLERKMKRK